VGDRLLARAGAAAAISALAAVKSRTVRGRIVDSVPPALLLSPVRGSAAFVSKQQPLRVAQPCPHVARLDVVARRCRAGPVDADEKPVALKVVKPPRGELFER
jgi:hypothetical protein